MKQNNPDTNWKIPEIWTYVLGGILIYFVVYPFMDKVVPDGEGQASLLATSLALVAIYFGKYCGQIITLRKKGIATGWFLFLAVLLVVLVSWLFLITQYPMGKKAGLNLFFFGLPFLFAGVLTGILMHLSKSTIEQNLQEAQMNAYHSESELSLLQSQLSPHFLFNTLNNMYGISITQHEKVPALLLKLSELLRYSLYQAKDEYVPVKNEISYLNNYIEFERLRMGTRLHLRTAFENIISDEMKIAPMLLIVFVENAFKHSKNSTDENVYVEMELKTFGRSFLFSIKNSGSQLRVPSGESDKQSYKPPGELNAEPGNGGLGLVNVRKRLALLYPNDHDLSIEATENQFSVMLQLKIK